MDTEFNSDSDYSNQRNDVSLIEIGMVVKEDMSSAAIVDTYHSFVKPIKNNGMIYPRIAAYTGISQADIDSGKPFPDALADIAELVDKYSISKIYTYSDYDAFVMRWNCKLYENIQNKKKVLKIMSDVQAPIEQKLKVTNLSLKSFSVLYGVTSENLHNALDDAVLLSDCMIRFSSGKPSDDMLKCYCKFEKKRNAYFKMKTAIGNMKQFGNVEEYVKMALNGDKFPDFAPDFK